MKGKKKRLIAAVAVIGALAAGGAAFTASATVPDTTAGYGTSHITGATALNLTYALNGTGDTITGATLVFAGDLWDHTVSPIVPFTVKAGFGTDTLTACTVGTYDSTAPNAYSATLGTTTVQCGSTDSAHAGAAYTQSTASSGTFNVAVSGGQSNP